MANNLYSDIYKVTEKIRGELGLHIDQLGELDAEIIDIVRGKNKSADFFDHIQKRLEVDEKTAKLIADQVNQNIFQIVKNNMKVEQRESFSEIERAGNISIDRPKTEAEISVTAADRGKILSGLENPPSWATNGTTQVPSNLPIGNGPIAAPGSPKQQSENHTEPLVDYLLNNASAKTAEQVAPKPQAPKPAPQATKGPDPYREEIK